MILSKVLLPWNIAKECYRWHQAIWTLFPGRPDAKREFLFRIEESTPGRDAIALVLSPWEPEVSSTETAARVIATRSFNPTLCVGQPLRFRLVANPVRCVVQEGRLNKKGKSKPRRVPVVSETARVEWLSRKLEGIAKLEVATAVSQAPLHFRKSGQIPGKIVPVLFEGVLLVQSPEALLTQLYAGIGPAKSFGCGLLSLAPAN
jgi:CRISPR system Cascade subunit CasE